MQVALHLQLGSYNYCQLSRELSFFLLVLFGSGSESLGGCPSAFALFTFGDLACVHGVVEYWQEYLLFVLIET